MTYETASRSAITATPRTDAEAELRGGSLLVRADFARQLERELAEAEAELERRQAKIMRLTSPSSSTTSQEGRADIPLDDGARLHWTDKSWSLFRGDAFIRYLDQYESSFIEGALRIAQPSIVSSTTPRVTDLMVDFACCQAYGSRWEAVYSSTHVHATKADMRRALEAAMGAAPSTGSSPMPHSELLGKWNALTLALGDELSDHNRVWKLVHAVADVIVGDRNAARSAITPSKGG